MNIKFAVPGSRRIIHMNFSARKDVRLEDVCIGIDSGPAKKGWHFVLLDYDEYYPDDFKGLLEKFGCRRGLVMESSHGKWHALSFTRMPYSDMLSFLSQSNSDNKHKFCVMNMGFSTLRISPKAGVPVKLQEVVEVEGRRFYNYDEEKKYLEVVAGGSLDAQKVIKKLGLGKAKLAIDKLEVVA